MRVLLLAALIAASTAQAKPPIPAPPGGDALLDRCAAIERVAETLKINGQYLLSDTVDDCGNLLGPQEYRTSETPWRWASVTKQIVAVAVMQQVEAGKLALDTAIAVYVPKLTIANAGRVTLRMLLQHTSGLPNVEDGPLDARKEMLVQYRADGPKPLLALSQICLGKAKAEPGARFEYNNCDTEIVGAVLEAVTGMPLSDLLAKTVFTPAGMTATRLVRPGEKPFGRPGYFADGRDDTFIDVGRFGAAGAIAGPPRDLAKFDRALMTGQLLKPESRAEIERGNPKLGYVALGVWSYAVPLKGCATPQKLVERRGEIGGVQVRNIIAPDRNLALIVFTDRPFDFGEPWQGKGGTYDLLSAALCSAS
jgi:D-alanyl-D-alanine carboxypeptidase